MIIGRTDEAGYYYEWMNISVGLYVFGGVWFGKEKRYKIKGKRDLRSDKICLT